MTKYYNLWTVLYSSSQELKVELAQEVMDKFLHTSILCREDLEPQHVSFFKFEEV